jgi:hypothetical protein
MLVAQARRPRTYHICIWPPVHQGINAKANQSLHCKSLNQLYHPAHDELAFMQACSIYIRHIMSISQTGQKLHLIKPQQPTSQNTSHMQAGTIDRNTPPSETWECNPRGLLTE